MCLESLYLGNIGCGVIHPGKVIFNSGFQKTLCFHHNIVIDIVALKKSILFGPVYMCSLRLICANNRHDGEIGAGMYTHI